MAKYRVPFMILPEVGDRIDMAFTVEAPDIDEAFKLAAEKCMKAITPLIEQRKKEIRWTETHDRDFNVFCHACAELVEQVDEGEVKESHFKPHNRIFPSLN